MVGRRSLRGRPVIDGVLTNAPAVVTALAAVGCRTLEDVEAVETDPYRANAIDCDDTSVVRVRTAGGLDVIAPSPCPHRSSARPRGAPRGHERPGAVRVHD